ncbi:hypothetical protein [Thermaerobacillus caldiproteolyticus]|uniref:hypothetical protein n=1 Tax=Thermaerobacillus caldiproteolyticus TaxID=247480 RepID=UPI0018F2269C|nr:hypothetical protein [Anoxybacillus caldiproteolyticus]
MLKNGEIIKGPFGPEIVEIKHCEQIDDGLYLVESIGRQTNRYYDRYLEQYQLEKHLEFCS